MSVQPRWRNGIRWPTNESHDTVDTSTVTDLPQSNESRLKLNSSSEDSNKVFAYEHRLKCRLEKSTNSTLRQQANPWTLFSANKIIILAPGGETFYLSHKKDEHQIVAIKEVKGVNVAEQFS